MPDCLVESLAIFAGFHQRFLNSPIVIHKQSAMNHDLKPAIFEHRSSLAPISHQSNDSFVIIDNAYKAIYRVVISCDWFKNLIFPSLSVVDFPLLRLKTHRIRIECFFVGIASIDIERHFFSNIVVN
jgi:hypothetical protein